MCIIYTYSLQRKYFWWVVKTVHQFIRSAHCVNYWLKKKKYALRKNRCYLLSEELVFPLFISFFFFWFSPYMIYEWENRNEDFLSKSILNFYTSLYKNGDRMEIFTFYKCKQNFKNSKTMNTNREIKWHLLILLLKIKKKSWYPFLEWLKILD